MWFSKMRDSSTEIWKKAATIPRTPRKCLEIWCGDHRQTPGGLQQTNEAKRFRRKALRCKTKYVQPQELGSIVCRHLTGPTESPPATLAKWLQGTVTPATEDVQTIWREATGLNAEQPALPSQLQKAALAILWLAVKGEELTEVLSTTYAEAAGVAGKQCWGLVLSCSARVTLMTYQVVVGVRYPELVLPSSNAWQFGRFIPHRETVCGAFLPVFWDVPRARMHGVIVDWLCARQNFAADSRSCLAVLHNQNRMVNDFRSSSWVTESKDSTVSCGVTTCAGMTAHTVILAQTRVGFLTDGRKESFRELAQDEQLIQLEEAYGRATVALTRARSLCVIMGPLDSRCCHSGGLAHVWGGSRLSWSCQRSLT